jgi:hypothetical protein
MHLIRKLLCILLDIWYNYYMKKINTNHKILDLQDKPIKRTEKEEWILKDILPTLVLESESENNAVRKIILAQKIQKADGEIELDVADFKIVKESVKDFKLFTDKSLNTLFEGRLQMYFDEVKE